MFRLAKRLYLRSYLLAEQFRHVRLAVETLRRGKYPPAKLGALIL